MTPLIQNYIFGISMLFDKLDDRRLEQDDIDLFKHKIIEQIEDYCDELDESHEIFKESSEYLLAQNVFSNGTFGEEIVDIRFQAVERFEDLIIDWITDVDSIRHLRNSTMSEFPDAISNDRIAIYTLYMSNVCSVKGVTVNILVDTSVNTYIQLYNKIDQAV